jgi:hypothetical protein
MLLAQACVPKAKVIYARRTNALGPGLFLGIATSDGSELGDEEASMLFEKATELALREEYLLSVFTNDEAEEGELLDISKNGTSPGTIIPWRTAPGPVRRRLAYAAVTVTFVAVAKGNTSATDQSLATQLLPSNKPWLGQGSHKEPTGQPMLAISVPPPTPSVVRVINDGGKSLLHSPLYLASSNNVLNNFTAPGSAIQATGPVQSSNSVRDYFLGRSVPPSSFPPRQDILKYQRMLSEAIDAADQKLKSDAHYLSGNSAGRNNEQEDSFKQALVRIGHDPSRNSHWEADQFITSVIRARNLSLNLASLGQYAEATKLKTTVLYSVHQIFGVNDLEHCWSESSTTQDRPYAKSTIK